MDDVTHHAVFIISCLYYLFFIVTGRVLILSTQQEIDMSSGSPLAPRNTERYPDISHFISPDST